VLRLLWSGGPSGVSHAGEFYPFEDLCSFPQPVGGPPPVHVGGSSLAAARRAGARGDGWFPGGALTPDERVRQFDVARAAAAEAGRDPAALEYTRWAAIDLPESSVGAYAAQGVTRLVVSATAGEPEEQREQMSAFAARFGLG
jgi:alkanesulfonate monooxygenase SsuD/methylene tetrahydromethanopterin reductase-like flavin-dependent oxidoreductase (luciferase family)